MKQIVHTVFGLIAGITVFTSCQEQTESIERTYPKEYLRVRGLQAEEKYSEALAAADSMRASETPENHFGAYADALNAWIYCYYDDNDSAIKYASKARESFIGLSSKATDIYNKMAADMEVILGYTYIAIHPDTAINYLNSCLTRYEALKDFKYLIKANQYLAEIYKNNHEYTKSLRYLDNVSDICDSIKFIDYDPSWVLDMHSDVANIATEIGDFRLVTNTLLSGSIYFDNASPYSKVYYLYHRSRAHFYQNEYALAAYTASRGETIAEMSRSSVFDLSSTYVIHGLALSRDGNIDEAIKYRDKADSIAQKHGLNLIKEKIMLDGEIEAHKKNFDRAHYLLFDSTATDHRVYYQASLLESQKAYHIARNDYHAAYDIQLRQKNISDSLQIKVLSPNDNRQLQHKINSSNRMRNELNSIRQKVNDQKDSQKTERYIIIIIAILAVAAAVIYGWNTYKRFKRKLEKEKHKLQQDLADKINELKRQEDMSHITTKHLSESIAYAEHIQRSILPSPEDLEMCNITGSFIFFSPLDIVSGDFYWFAQKGDHLIVCCADCTGHGIPGAFMSMIASTIINDICNRSNEDVKPSYILEELDSALLDELGHNKSEDGRAKDGCDISIISLNTKNKVLNVASAKRPVIIIKDQEMIEVKGTKRSIGELESTIRERKFEDTEIQLHTNDTIYMFSDGYSDQFGGQNNSRLNVKNIKRFLRATHNDDMDEQCLTMQDFFTQWKGDYPQTDDVLFMGIMV